MICVFRNDKKNHMHERFVLVEQRQCAHHTVRQSTPAERRRSQKGGMLIKNCIGCDGDCSTFVSDGIAWRGSLAARRREREDELRDDINVYGSTNCLRAAPRCCDAASSLPPRCASLIDCCEKSFVRPRLSLNYREACHIGCNNRVGLI